MDRAELLGRLATAPDRVASAARLVAASEAASPPAPGDWSAREVIGHLVSVETDVWQARLDSLEVAAEPVWAWTEPGVSEALEAATLEGAIRLLADLRAVTLARASALDDAAWRRVGIHATYGRLNVAGLLRVAVDHDEDHLAGLAARLR